VLAPFAKGGVDLFTEALSLHMAHAGAAAQASRAIWRISDESERAADASARVRAAAKAYVAARLSCPAPAAAICVSLVRKRTVALLMNALRRHPDDALQAEFACHAMWNLAKLRA
jgi:hypothetical protein